MNRTLDEGATLGEFRGSVRFDMRCWIGPLELSPREAVRLKAFVGSVLATPQNIAARIKQLTIARATQSD